MSRVGANETANKLRQRCSSLCFLLGILYLDIAGMQLHAATSRDSNLDQHIPACSQLRIAVSNAGRAAQPPSIQSHWRPRPTNPRRQPQRRGASQSPTCPAPRVGVVS